MKRMLVILLLFSLFVTGCNFYGKNEYPDQSLIVYSVRNVTHYEYQKKVAISIRYSSSADSLDLRIDGDDDSWLSTNFNYKSILTGKFEKVGWYDDNLFILMDEVYYSFDVDKYEVPHLDEEGNYQEPVYELAEYSKTEFVTAYPNYNSFDWYGH